METSIKNRVKKNFLDQKIMSSIGAFVSEVEQGRVSIELPFKEELSRQNDFFHEGLIAMIADSACSYSAMTFMPATAEVISVEHKINFLSPARGEKIIARAELIKPGRSLMVCTADIFIVNDGKESLVAKMQATMITKEKASLIS